jgi:hypothetical protein
MMELEEDTVIGVCVGIILSMVVAAPIFTVAIIVNVVSTLTA